MRGLLIYNRKDIEKNRSFADWIISEFDRKDIPVDLLIREDFYKNRKLQEEYAFIINRTRDYNLSLNFELDGLAVFNNSEITLLGNNKLAAYKYAKKQNYPYPQIYKSLQGVKNFLTKPIYGHGGVDIYLNQQDKISEDHLIQEYIDNIVGDIRFYILNNKILHAVIRSNKDKITSNYSLGGEFSIYRYTEDEGRFILDFIKELEIDYAGVDFFLLKSGELIFNEIEDVVGSRMLSDLKINDTVPKLVNHIISKIMLDNC